MPDRWRDHSVYPTWTWFHASPTLGGPTRRKGWALGEQSTSVIPDEKDWFPKWKAGLHIDRWRVL